MTLDTLRLHVTYRLARRLAQWGGFDLLYTPRFAFADELRALNAEWQRETGSRERLSWAHWNLYQLARSVADLPGDTVECGVNTGRGSWAIRAGACKPHHCFDSWEGLSEPQAADGAGWKAGDLTSSYDLVQIHMSMFSRVYFYRGWIPARFAEVADRHFSLVHIDVDLYQPTLDSLAFFYPRVVPGGVIVCDDYGAKVSPGSKTATDEFFADKPERIIHLAGTGQAVAWRRA